MKCHIRMGGPRASLRATRAGGRRSKRAGGRRAGGRSGEAERGGGAGRSQPAAAAAAWVRPPARPLAALSAAARRPAPPASASPDPRGPPRSLADQPRRARPGAPALAGRVAPAGAGQGVWSIQEAPGPSGEGGGGCRGRNPARGPVIAGGLAEDVPGLGRRRPDRSERPALVSPCWPW